MSSEVVVQKTPINDTDLYTKLKELERQLELCEIQVYFFNY